MHGNDVKAHVSQAPVLKVLAIVLAVPPRELFDLCLLFLIHCVERGEILFCSFGPCFDLDEYEAVGLLRDDVEFSSFARPVCMPYDVAFSCEIANCCALSSPAQGELFLQSAT